MPQQPNANTHTAQIQQMEIEQSKTISRTSNFLELQSNSADVDTEVDIVITIFGGIVSLGYHCSHITTYWGFHRAQTSYLCTYFYLLLCAYKAHMVDTKTSLNLILGGQ